MLTFEFALLSITSSNVLSGVLFVFNQFGGSSHVWILINFVTNLNNRHNQPKNVDFKPLAVTGNFHVGQSWTIQQTHAAGKKRQTKSIYCYAVRFLDLTGWNTCMKAVSDGLLFCIKTPPSLPNKVYIFIFLQERGSIHFFFLIQVLFSFKLNSSSCIAIPQNKETYTLDKP